MSGKPPIGRPDLNRLRVMFRKDGRLAYLGHLEVINTIERSVRRAKLPFSVGNGFAQRMRIQFSQALPVGAASRAEYVDVYLTDRIDAKEAFERFAESSPSALAPVDAAYVQSRMPALEAWLTRSLWQVRLLGTGDDFSASHLDESLEALRGVGHIDFMRGDKPRTIGLDTTLVSWDVADGATEGGFSAIDMRLETRSSNLGALRPAVLMEAAFKRGELGGSVLDSLRVERMGQWHEGEDGSLIDPMAAELRI